ncbi:MAG: GNAT family N-acetyltransferase [Marmoricola sp.]
MTRHNEYGQPIGDALDWSPRPRVSPITLPGKHVRVEPWSHAHLESLYAALCVGSPPSTWTYINGGPFDAPDGLRGWMDALEADPGLVPHVICLPDGRAVGAASYCRLDEANGSVEVGAIVLGSELQRTAAATEAMYLMARHVFDDLGYRRYEWKCDTHNAPSQRAARRLGFVHEGTFRNALVYKGRNRDTDWFSITDEEWPGVRAAFEGWLDRDNQRDGVQVRSLEEFRA